jgi:hypothetical protein
VTLPTGSGWFFQGSGKCFRSLDEYYRLWISFIADRVKLIGKRNEDNFVAPLRQYVAILDGC